MEGPTRGNLSNRGVPAQEACAVQSSSVTNLPLHMSVQRVHSCHGIHKCCTLHGPAFDITKHFTKKSSDQSTL
jgi:hypothetical protein